MNKNTILLASTAVMIGLGGFAIAQDSIPATQPPAEQIQASTDDAATKGRKHVRGKHKHRHCDDETRGDWGHGHDDDARDDHDDHDDTAEEDHARAANRVTDSPA